MSGLEELTDEEIERVLEEKKRRDEQRLKAQIDEVLKRKGLYARCKNCSIPFTEEEVQQWDVCPACGCREVKLL